MCVCLWFVASLLCVSVSGLWGHYCVYLSLVCGVITVCVCLWFVGSLLCVSVSGLWGDIVR